MENKTPQRTFKVKESSQLDEGAHKGKIVDIQYRDEPFAYIDLIIEVPDCAFQLKYGVSQYLSPSSQFGKLLETFGHTVIPNSDLTEEDISKIFKDREVKFVTINESYKKDGETRQASIIAKGSLKPTA
jgi:hypothetical protein